MRASRETELVALFPIQVVTAWLGNTPAIAMQHYLQVRDSDFEKAIEGTLIPVIVPSPEATILPNEGNVKCNAKCNAVRSRPRSPRFACVYRSHFPV
jgi:hypothetical protein